MSYLERFSTAKHRSFFLFIAFAIFIGLLAFNDYGISTDEPQMYAYGVQVFSYLFLHGPIPEAFDWTFHNPITHVFLSSVQYVFGVKVPQHIWFMRHLLSYGLFLFTFAALYRIALFLFKDRWQMGILACCMLFLSPRVFAHSFYNPKDIPALITFIISMTTLFVIRAKDYQWKWLLLHAFTCAMSTSIRTSGLFVPLFTIMAMSVDMHHVPKLLTKRSALFFGMFCVAIWVIWPRLWTAPVSHFIEAFTSNASREGGGLLLGTFYSYTPWYYAFVWMTVTTPIVYSLLFFIGLISIIANIIKNPLQYLQEESDWILILLWYVGPLAALILLKAGIFGEWRHVLFIYPAFVLIAVKGLLVTKSHYNQVIRRAGSILLACSMTWTGIWMMANHPREYAYFSIPSTWVEGNFEKDYWGLSFYEGLKWVLENDKNSTVKVYTSARVAYVNGDLLPRTEWERLRFVSARSASYILDNFQWNNYQKTLPDNKAMHTITASALELLTVYRGPDTTGKYLQHSE